MRIVDGVSAFLCALVLSASPCVWSQTASPTALQRVDASPAHAFYSPYLLYVPPARVGVGGAAQILVISTNTGRVTDDDAVAESLTRKMAGRYAEWADELGVVLLVPVFPRLQSQATVYTHALGRSAMLASEPRLKRLDLQLIAMIDDARRRLATAQGMQVAERVLIYGYSANAMFANRFVFMHPDRVQASAMGSPGGWALAPVAKWRGRRLPYPVGVADWRQITGEKFHLKAVARVSQFLFMGDADTNDSVVYRDSYEPEARQLVFDLFGPTLMARWPTTVALYERRLPKVELKLYPGLKHSENRVVRDDVIAFFRGRLASQ